MRRVPRYRRNRTFEGSSFRFRLILRSRGKHGGVEKKREKESNVGERTRRKSSSSPFDFFDVLSAASRAQLKGYSSVGEMIEDNNLQGQGFVCYKCNELPI